MLEWAARNKVKGHLFKCDVIPKVPSGIFTQCSKELVNRLLKARTIAIHATAPAQRSKSSKATRSNNRNEWKVKRKFKSELLFVLRYSGTALPGTLCSPPASAERDCHYLPARLKRIIYLSACENHI